MSHVLFVSCFLTPNPVSTLLLPATASLSLLILFGFSTALLWNGGRVLTSQHAVGTR